MPERIESRRTSHIWLPRALAALVCLVLCTITGVRAVAPVASVNVASGDARIALVVGNANYASSPLVNPVNDARSMAKALQGLGFRVILLEDATIRQMADAAREFGDNLQKGGVGLFYYAGHGMQIKGRNYLIPVGADIQREDEVSFNAFDAALLLEKMESAKTRVNIVILDACRNNPFTRSFRSSAQGLAVMEAPLGSYVSFATAPARVASDGNNGNGLFTQHLLEAMKTPGLKIEEVFKQVRIGVMNDSKGEQIPWDNSSLTGDFYFTPPDGHAAAGSSVVVPIQRIAGADTPARATTAEGPQRDALKTPRPSTSEPAHPSSKPAAASDDRLALVKSTQSPPMKPPAAPAAAPAPKADPAAAEAYKRGLAAKQAGDLGGAAEAFGRAAEGGNAGGQYEMALLLKAGRRPVTQDLPRAHRLFLQSAEQGNTAGQFEVAQAYAQGIGVAKNCAQARKWALKGAESGSAEAAALAGELNKMDCEGQKDPQQAARWFRIAAEKGLPNAQFSLGVILMNGDGVPKDLQEARKWLTAAASKGNPSARFYLDRIGTN